MKITMRGLILSCLSASCLLACNKHSNSNPDGTIYSKTGAKTGTVVFSHNNLQRGQPLLASLTGGTATSIRWSVEANPTTVHITPANNQATILFARPGSFRVTASSLGADSSVQDSSWKVITVSDSVYQAPPPSGSDTTSLAGDQITLTPAVDSNANLYLLVQTKKAYGCSPTLVYGMISGANGTGGISLDFIEVTSDGTVTCNGAQNPASVYLFPETTSKWSNGSYPLTALMNGITYTGTLTITSTEYTFSWNYSSGVLISPLQINK